MNHTSLNPSSSLSSMIYRAPWIVIDTAGEIYPDSPGVIADGALFVVDNIIRAVGKFKEIIREYGGFPVQDHDGRILAPALINGHCHLELSSMGLVVADDGQGDYDGDLTRWIRKLLQARDAFQQEPGFGEKLLRQAGKVLDQMAAEGVAFAGDTGNSLTSREIGRDQRIKVIFLLELLGLTKKSEEQTMLRLERVSADESPVVSCTAHAPYSTTPVMIQKIKSMADSRGSIFSIHTAESQQEVEFLQSGSGRFLEFLRERGAWDNSFVTPGVGSVHYLERLGVLNEKTLCVHVVHVDPEEIKILASRNAKICLCPGSNRFLGVGKAPVTEFLDHGILPALGTDSRASNPMLSIWREMKLLREDHPGLSPATVFSMATRGGAESWGIDTEFGTMETGKQGRIMSVGFGSDINSGHDLLEYMTTVGESVQVEWAG